MAVKNIHKDRARFWLPKLDFESHIGQKLRLKLAKDEQNVYEYHYHRICVYQWRNFQGFVSMQPLIKNNPKNGAPEEFKNFSAKFYLLLILKFSFKNVSK